jgi:peroxiredoxin
MSPSRTLWLLPIACILVGTGIWWGSHTSFLAWTDWEAPIPGALAPDFRLPPLDPATTSGRLSTYRPHLVLLTFWATWCKPCKQELPAIQTLATKYYDQGLRIVAVSIDHEGALATAPFAHMLGLSFPILHDRENEVAHQYRVQAIPQHFLIGRDGRIIWRKMGAIDWTTEQEAELRTHLAAIP